jgi:hypothetical protein
MARTKSSPSRDQDDGGSPGASGGWTGVFRQGYGATPRGAAGQQAAALLDAAVASLPADGLHAATPTAAVQEA